MNRSVMLRPICRTLLALFGLFQTAFLAASAPDHAALLARCDMKWESLPQGYTNGAWTGNGRLGTIFWQEKDGSLRFEINRGDLYDRRRKDHGYGVLHSTCRLPNGALHLTLPGNKPTGRLHLDLWNAEIRGTLRNDTGTLTLRSYTHATEPVIIIETSGATPAMDFRPVPARSYRSKDRPKNYQAYPAQTREDDGDIAVSVQEMPEDARYQTDGMGAAQHATAWKTMELGNKRRVTCVALGFSSPGRTARAEAIAAVRRAMEAGPEKLKASHRAWWHMHYAKSFLSFPDPRLESYYWIQVYKMGAAARPDGPIVDLMGPWYQKTPWPAVWWNLNIQLTYWPFHTSGHSDLARPLVDTLWNQRRNLAANAGNPDGDAYAIARYSALDCHSGNGDELGNLPWAMHNLWLHYRTTMDEPMLRDQIFPLMKGAFLHLSNLLTEGPDGRLHLPPSGSPEYANHVEDCNYSAACLRWLAGAIIAADARLKTADPVAARCREVLDKLAPYAADETGFMIGKRMPYAKSHRHWSHLFMIYPFHEWTFDDPAQAPMVEKSLRHWLSKPNAFFGYSHVAAASMHALAGRGGEAAKSLHDYLHFEGCLSNGLYREAGPVIETPLFAARAIQEMMLTSHGDLIRVFPGIPAGWKDVVFTDFRAEGAFLVSAERRDGKTIAVRVHSLAGEPCRIRHGVAGPVKAAGNRAFVIKPIAGDGSVEIDLKKGETVTLHAGETPPAIRPVPVKPISQAAPWGGSKPVTAR